MNKSVRAQEITIGIIMVPVSFFIIQNVYADFLAKKINGILDIAIYLLLGVLAIFMLIYGLMWIFPVLRNLIPETKSKKCKTCSQPAKDVFIVNGTKKEGIYCRRHLIEKFHHAFLTFPYKMVVFHPEQEREYCGTMYPYYPVGEMVSRYRFGKNQEETIRKILSSISGKCQECRKQEAQVAYFAKGILQWDGSGPLLEKVIGAPQLCCNECTLKMIEPALTANKEFFEDNGLFAPYKEEGVYVNTYL